MSEDDENDDGTVYSTDFSEYVEKEEEDVEAEDEEDEDES